MLMFWPRSSCFGFSWPVLVARFHTATDINSSYLHQAQYFPCCRSLGCGARLRFLIRMMGRVYAGDGGGERAVTRGLLPLGEIDWAAIPVSYASAHTRQVLSGSTAIADPTPRPGRRSFCSSHGLCLGNNTTWNTHARRPFNEGVEYF